MRYYLDTEFNENVHPIDLISVGIISQDDREWYGVHRDYVRYPMYEHEGRPADNYPIIHSCNDWVKKNVLPVLFQQNGPGKAATWFTGDDVKMRDAIVEFVGDDQSPEFWAYYGDYDWFLLTRLFKSFDKMPKKWPQICYDVHQYAKHHGLHKGLSSSRETSIHRPMHNALVDARWTKAAFDAIKTKAHAASNDKERVIWP